MIDLYGIKNCDSVKKAIKFFKAHNIAFELHDFKEQSVGPKEISSWLQQVPMKTLFNTRSTTFRNLNLKELQLDEEEQKKWLFKENLLLKRPIIDYNGTIIVGFDEENYKGIFL